MTNKPLNFFLAVLLKITEPKISLSHTDKYLINNTVLKI